jgi:hypothetical protein
LRELHAPIKVRRSPIHEVSLGTPWAVLASFILKLVWCFDQLASNTGTHVCNFVKVCSGHSLRPFGQALGDTLHADVLRTFICSAIDFFIDFVPLFRFLAGRSDMVAEYLTKVSRNCSVAAYYYVLDSRSTLAGRLY